MKRLLLPVLLLLAQLPLVAQPSDSVFMSGFVDRARKKMNADANEGKKIIDSLKTFADRHHSKFFIAEYHKMMGIYHYRTSQYDSAYKHYHKALPVYEELQIELEQAKVFVNLAMIFNRKGDYKETIRYALQAHKLFEKVGEKKGVGVALNMVGIVNFQNKDFEGALVYFKKYLQNARMANDSVEIASGYTNIGATFSELFRYDSALVYHRKALALHDYNGNKYGTGNTLQNIAFVFKKQTQPDSAVIYYNKAADYYRNLNNPSGLTETNLNLGILYNQLGQHKKAVSYLEPALESSLVIDEDLLQQQSLLALAQSHEAIGNPSKALKFYKNYNSVKDSIFNENNRKNIEELKTKYETDQKEQQIELQGLQLAQQNAALQRNYLIIAGLATTVFLLAVIFVLLRNRLKRKHQILEKEKELAIREAYIRATIESQETERKRFAQDLHDGMGQLISAVRLTIHPINKDTSLEDRVNLAAKAEGLLNDMHHEIRSVAFNLMPQTLVQHGLVPALREMGERINHSGRVTVRISSFDVPARLTELHEISLYRIIQEWINNVVKYSDASVIEVQMIGHDDEINVTIEDNGKGFDPEILTISKGNGWKNIRSRINLLKASIDVDTSPGRNGTTILMKVPKVAKRELTTIE